MSRFSIREASLRDASRILEIYAPYITDTAITFEYEVPSLTEFEERMERIRKRFPYLVCEEDGLVIGYAYADTYMIRAAYDWCVDLSVYVDREKRNCGAGTLLYKALLALLKEMHIQNAYAVITGCNERSLDFHRKLGFETFAVFKNTGYKHGTWLDVTWMEYFLGEHEEKPKPVIWAPDLPALQRAQIIKQVTEETV